MRFERFALPAATALVVAGVAGGLLLLGSPAHQRDAALDRRRLNDLATIASALHARDAAAAPAALPAGLVAAGGGAPPLTDPVTNRPYAYARESATRYRLCATFTLPSDDDDDPYRSVWRHRAGRACWRFDVRRDASPLGAAASS